MLKGWGFASNNRINKETALLVKSRVALYEATFEKYHKGTGRVPGDANWPGKKVHPNFTLDVDKEVDFFLTQALEAAEQVADKVTLTQNTGVADPETISTTSGWNPYFEMFASLDLSKNSEVLLWRSYAKTGSYSITHGAPAWVQSGSNNGLLKTYVESFLMKDGMPWYAATTSAPYMGDKTLDDVKPTVTTACNCLCSVKAISCLFIHSKQQVQFNISCRTQYQTVRKCKTAPAIVFVNMPASTLHRMYGVKLNQLQVVSSSVV